MNHADVAKALEIIRIKRKHALDRIDIHDGDQSGIMNFDPLHLVSRYDLLSCAVDRRNVRQQRK